MTPRANVVRLVEDVELRGTVLWDSARGRGWPVNPMGKFILSEMPATESGISSSLSARSGMPIEFAQEHVSSFVALLRSRALVVAHRRDFAATVLHLQAAALGLLAAGVSGTTSPSPRRYGVSSHSYTAIALSVLRGTARSAATLAILAALGLVLVLGPLHSISPLTIITLSLALGGGVVVHELGHALVLKGVPTAVVVRSMRPSILHPPLSKRRAFATTIGGPVAGLGVGAVLVSAAAIFGSSYLALAAIVTVCQGAGLTCLSSDGRKLCAGV